MDFAAFGCLNRFYEEHLVIEDAKKTPETLPFTVAVLTIKPHNAYGNEKFPYFAVSGNFARRSDGLGDSPAPPTNAHASAVSPSRVDVAWTDNATDETSFVLERKRGSMGTWAVIANPVPNAFSYSDTGVSPTNAYYYRVKAVNADGESSYSTSTTGAVTPAADAQTAPGNPSVTCIAYSKNLISWTDLNTSEDGYRIERKVGAGAWALVANTLPNVVSYKDESLSADTAYIYRVRAYNIYYTSTWSSDLNGPTWKPYVSAMTATNDVISASGTYSFRVERTASSPNPLTVALTTTVPGATIPASVTIPANSRSVGFSLSTNAAQTALDYKTVLATAEGWSQNLPVQIRTTTEPNAPSNLTAIGGPGAVWLNWRNPQSYFGTTNVGVRVERRELGGTFQFIAGVTTSSRYVDLTAQPGFSYEYRLSVVNGSNAIVSSSNIASVVANSGSPAISVSGVAANPTESFTISTSGSPDLKIDVYIDGNYFTSGDPETDFTPGGQPAAFIDISRLNPGTHQLVVVTNSSSANGYSASYGFSITGTARRLVNDGVCVPEIGYYPHLGMLLQTNTLIWRITLKNHYGTQIRQWSGFGNSANVTWDGKDQSGNIVPRDRYSVYVEEDGTQVGYGDVVRAAANPTYLSLIMLQNGGQAYNTCAGLADRVNESLDSYYGTGINAAVLVYTEHSVVPTLLFNYVKYALKTATHVHLDGHGTPTIFEFGDNYKIETGDFNHNNESIYIGKSVLDRGYGMTWLWLDTCFNGGRAENGPLGQMSATPDFSWATSARMSFSLYDGGFMAWNGESWVNATGTFLAAENTWGRWRRQFLVKFIGSHYSMLDAIVYAHLHCAPQNFPPGFYPYSYWENNGDIVDKLTLAGEVYMP